VRLVLLLELKDLLREFFGLHECLFKIPLGHFYPDALIAFPELPCPSYFFNALLFLWHCRQINCFSFPAHWLKRMRAGSEEGETASFNPLPKN
jgi:hypothetical protein